MEDLYKNRVVASLTTMPYRYEKLLKTLKSLHNQTYKLDAIYLAVPKVSRRLNIEYPPVPNDISSLCTVVSCEDYGPITKIYGALYCEEDSETIIITFDDDMFYPCDIVESLVKHHQKYPNSAIGSSGMLVKYNCPFCAITPNEDRFVYRIPKFYVPLEGRRVDSIFGYPGALYIRKFFPKKENLNELFKYSLMNEDMFMNDDIVISGYLSLFNIERRIFQDVPKVSFIVDENGHRNRNENEISYNLDKFFHRLNNAIIHCKSLGMYSRTEPVDFSETIFGIGAVIVITIIVATIAVFYIINNM